MWAKIAYVTVVYLIYGSVCYTGINIPYGAMAAVLTSDPKEKQVFRLSEVWERFWRDL